MRKRFGFVMILLAVLCLVGLTLLATDSQAMEELDSGKCGENLTWTLTDDGVLTISGNGEMEDYTSDQYGTEGAPWSGLSYHIIKVVIEEGVTGIGDYAFFDCFCMTDISIPASLTSIDKSAFLECISLNAVYIEDIVAWCRIQFFNESSNPLYYADELYLDRELVTDVVIPDGTSYIWEYAFYNYEKLTSITIPDSVAFIGKSAFYNCSNIESMTLPFVGGSKTSDYLFLGYVFGASNYDENTEYVPESLKTVIVSGAHSDIGHYAFYGCTSLTSITISDGVTNIGDRAFASCFNLTSISLPDSLTGMGIYAFNGCSNLVYNEYDSAKYLGNAQNPYVTLVQVKYTGIKSCTIHERTKVICSDAFGYCGNLTSISIPESVISIGDFAFRNCSSLNAVYTADIAAWCGIEFGDEKSNPLYYVKKLYLNGELVTDLVIPAGTDCIGDYAFYNCSDLTSVMIPDSVTSIGENAFYNCSKLTDIVIPDSVTSIGSGAFSGCSSLETITIPFVGARVQTSYDETTLFGYIFGKEEFENSVYVKQVSGTILSGSAVLYDTEDYYIPASLKTVTVTGGGYENAYKIPNGAFSGCKNISNVILGAGVWGVGDNAFRNCEALESIDVPRGPIGEYAFYNCTGLKTVILPYFQMACYNAFENCDNIWHVLFRGTWDDWKYYPFSSAPTRHYGCDGDEMIDAEKKVCAICQASCAHEWDDGIVTKEPTCVDDGEAVYTCELCRLTETRSVAAPGHIHTSEITTVPTCEAPGVKTYTCHCGDTYTEEIPATGHTEVIDPAVAPTCTETGLTEGKHCDLCDEVFVAQEEIPATGHSHEVAVTDATCTEDGSKVYTCHCGDSYTEEIAATGHDYTDVVTEPTCTEAGYTTHTCGNCGTSYTDNHVDAMGHNYVDGICEHCGMPEVEPGDVNGDGRVNTRDARLLLRYLAGMAAESELDLAAADFNGDGRLNVRDARAILNYIAGLN